MNPLEGLCLFHCPVCAQCNFENEHEQVSLNRISLQATTEHTQILADFQRYSSQDTVMPPPLTLHEIAFDT